jgi:hypothetical protein
VYALGPDGKVADGCRALEAVRVIHDLDDLFENLRGARDRLRRGIVVSEEVKKRLGQPSPQPHSTARIEAHVNTNPIRPAERRYVQEHGSVAFDQILARLFANCLPRIENPVMTARSRRLIGYTRPTSEFENMHQ